MRVNRSEFLKILESVTSGLASKENIEQSTCFVFLDKRVYTFNDEVSCSRDSPLTLTGAVKAKPLLDLLSKLQEDEVDIESTDAELIIKGKRKKSGIRKEAEVLLPVEAVEKAETWSELPADFTEAVNIVYNCASKEESEFSLTCVHLSRDYIEATDRFQIARYPIELPIANVDGVLVRATSIKSVVGYDMTEMAETDAWIHFRNPAGLVMSCRRYVEDYKDLSAFLAVEGSKDITFPGGLEEMIAKARIFSEDNIVGNHISVDLSRERIVIQGEGAAGWYKEMRQVVYKGEPMKFLVAPNLLIEIAKKSNDCKLDEGRLIVDTGRFVYVSCTESK